VHEADDTLDADAPGEGDAGQEGGGEETARDVGGKDGGARVAKREEEGQGRKLSEDEGPENPRRMATDLAKRRKRRGTHIKKRENEQASDTAPGT